MTFRQLRQILPALLLLGATAAGAEEPARDCDTALREADAALSAGAFEVARRTYARCLDSSVADGDFDSGSRSACGLAQALMELGEFEQGRRLAEQAIELALRAGDPVREAKAIEALGDAYFCVRDYETALSTFERALDVAEDAGESATQAYLLKNIGITHMVLGHSEQAMLYLDRAARQPGGGDDLSVSILGNLGTVYRRLGAHALALSSFRQAFEVAERRGYPQELVDIHGRLGILLMELDLPQRAVEHFEQAEPLVDQAGQGHRGWLLEVLAGAYEMLGRLDDAEEVLQRVLRLREATGDRYGIAYALVALGYLDRERRPELARQAFRRAAEISSDIGFDWAYGARAQLGAMLHREGDLDGAADAYAEALDALDSYRDEFSDPEDRLSTISGNEWAYHGLIELLLERREPGDGPSAFLTWERARARLLLEAMVESRLEPPDDFPPEMRRREEQLRRERVELQDALGSTAAGQGRRSLLDALMRVELQGDKLTEAIRRHSPRYASLRYPEPLTVNGTQQLLDAQTALISYCITDTQVVAFLVTADAFHAELLPAIADRLPMQVANLVELLARKRRWEPVARRLHEELFAPLLRHIGPEVLDLIVVPDGALHHLPFEILLGPDAADEPSLLVQRFSVAYAPAATVLSQLALRPEAEDTQVPRLLLFAQPEVGSVESDGGDAVTNSLRTLYELEGLQVGPIPFSGEEARVVGRFAGPGSAVYIGVEATEQRLKSAALDTFQILHFATHALISRTDPWRSALVLGPTAGGTEDGFLQAREIAGLRLAPELVVLSACRTARGRVLAGEGTHGLSRAFLQAGARSVVGSLWDVEDGRTADLMAAFYHHLDEGHSKTRALRLAKLDRLAIDDPSSWAAFVLIGEPHATINLPHARGAQHWVWAAAGVAVLALLVAVPTVWRRRFSSPNPTQVDSSEPHPPPSEPHPG